MSKSETTIQKTHPSGTWKVVRSMAVPASVTPAHSNNSLTNDQSGSRKIQKLEEESVQFKPRRSPGYFDTIDHSISKS